MRRLEARVVAALALTLTLTLFGAVRVSAKRPNRAPRHFKALFNGKDLTNWQGLIELPTRLKMSPDERKEAQAKADEVMRAHWTVRDGVLHYDGKGQSLQTAKDFRNFELWVDWKIKPKGDSGIYLRGAPQVQIWDNPIGSGGLYNNQKGPHDPLLVADKPIGEWNRFWIRMVGEKVWVKLNGKLVVDGTVLENYWNRSIPIYPTGPIELQHHGDELEFRNIFVRELSDDAR